MCKKQFWANPYQTEHLTRVSWVEGSQVELEETIFYAESGGQESDSGTIAGIAVTKAENKGEPFVIPWSKMPRLVWVKRCGFKSTGRVVIN